MTNHDANSVGMCWLTMTGGTIFVYLLFRSCIQSHKGIVKADTMLCISGETSKTDLNGTTPIQSYFTFRGW